MHKKVKKKSRSVNHAFGYSITAMTFCKLRPTQKAKKKSHMLLTIFFGSIGVMEAIPRDNSFCGIHIHLAAPCHLLVEGRY